jgi:hypothetical protein
MRVEAHLILTLSRRFTLNLGCSRTLSRSCPLSGEARPPIRQEVIGLRLLYKAPAVSATEQDYYCISFLTEHLKNSFIVFPI